MRGKYFQWQDWLVYNLSVLKYISIAKSVAKMVMANQRQISSKTLNGKSEAKMLMANLRQISETAEVWFLKMHVVPSII